MTIHKETVAKIIAKAWGNGHQNLFNRFITAKVLDDMGYTDIAKLLMTHGEEYYMDVLERSIKYH